MRIRKLSLQAFGPYVGKVALDFARGLGENRCFLIHGMTGAGKTTLLDAICFALYGEASGSLRTGTMLRSDKAAPETETWVELEFALGTRGYRVLRSPAYRREDRKSATRARAELYVQRGGAEELLVTGTSEVTEYLETLTGFRCEQFRQVVLLPQGEFRAFLMSDSRRRGELMQALFHTERYAALEKRLKERALDLAARARDCRAQQAQLLTQAEVASAEELAAVFAQREQALTACRERTTSLRLAHEERQRRLVSGQTLAAVFARLAQAEKDCASDEKKKESVEMFRAQLAQAEQAAALLDKERQAAEEAAAEVRSSKEAERLAAAAAQAKQAATQAAQQLAVQQEKEEERAALRRKVQQLELAKRAAAEAERLAHALAAAERREAACRVERIDTETAAEQAKLRLERLQALERLGKAVSLARGLEDGTPCPVCGSCSHPHPAEAQDVVPEEQEVHEAAKVLEKLRQRVRGAQEEEQKAAAAAAALKGQLAAQKENLPEGVAPAAAAVNRAWCEASRVLQESEQVLKQCEEASRRTETAASASAASAKSAAAHAEQQRARAVQAQQQFAAARADAGFSTQAAYDAALAGRWCEKAHRDEVAQHIRAFEDAALRHRAAREDAARETAGQTAPDLAALKAAASAAEAAWRQAARQESETALRIEQGKKWQAALQKLAVEEKSIEQAYGLAGRLAQVAGGEQPYRIHFQTYIQRSIFRDVMDAANERLGTMSGQRYALALGSQSDGRKADGLEIAVYDAYTGKCREAQSLSGGESFLASLSLALGLADVVERYAGGIRLDTMFIDEGFGSLDSETLDLAVEALLKLQEGGRVIGIISHVEELAARIPCRLEVTKSPEGSAAHFVTGTARQ